MKFTKSSYNMSGSGGGSSAVAATHRDDTLGLLRTDTRASVDRQNRSRVYPQTNPLMVADGHNNRQNGLSGDLDFIDDQRRPSGRGSEHGREAFGRDMSRGSDGENSRDSGRNRRETPPGDGEYSRRDDSGKTRRKRENDRGSEYDRDAFQRGDDKYSRREDGAFGSGSDGENSHGVYSLKDDDGKPRPNGGDNSLESAENARKSSRERGVDVGAKDRSNDEYSWRGDEEKAANDRSSTPNDQLYPSLGSVDNNGKGQRSLPGDGNSSPDFGRKLGNKSGDRQTSKNGANDDDASVDSLRKKRATGDSKQEEDVQEGEEISGGAQKSKSIQVPRLPQGEKANQTEQQPEESAQEKAERECKEWEEKDLEKWDLMWEEKAEKKAKMTNKAKRQKVMQTIVDVIVFFITIPF